MRIAIFASTLGVEATGVSMAVANAATHLADAGNEVTVITTDCGYRGQAVSAFVNVPPAVKMRVFTSKGKLNRRIYRSKELIEWIRCHVAEFDVLEVHGIWTYSGMVAARIFGANGKPYVLTPHGTMTRYDWRKSTIRRKLFFRLGYDAVWNNAHAIRFLSAGEQKTSYYDARGQAIVIPNGVDLQSAPTPEARTAARERLGIRPEARVLLFLGRIVHQKGVKETVAAFALAAQEQDNLWLYLVGPAIGKYGSELRAQIAMSPFRHRIIATGAIFGQAKDDYFRAADAFITLSHNEGLSIANLEALAYGLPAILTRASNLEYLDEYGAGIYSNHDPVQAAADILRLMRNSTELAAASNGARRFVEEKFSWKRVTRQLIALYEQISEDACLTSRVG
jgi:glycosyltransferase involved in cell wall biosynthesis